MAIVVEHEKRKKEILDKALDLFMENGYEDVTFQKIDWSKIKYISKDLHEELQKRVKPQRNDILFSFFVQSLTDSA